ncbi:MAG: hypothetical protein ACXVYI_06690 [Mycobacterium sp.]
MSRSVAPAPARNLGRRLAVIFHASTARTRLRRRLFLVSAPVAVVLLLAAAKMIVVAAVGHSAATDFRQRDTEALRHDVAWLRIFDVIDPAKTSFAAGDSDVLEGRLRDADDRFSQSLSRSGESQACPVRVNLLLVRETMGDLAARAANTHEAERLYTAALAVATEAPALCFAGNDDPDPDRRATRDEAIPRLQQKLDLLHRAPPTAIAPPQPGPPPPPGGPAPGRDHQSPDGAAVRDPGSPDRIPVVDSGPPPARVLGPGDPLDRLQRLLDNSNASGDNQE